MGADIHTFIERKMPSGNWAYMGNLDHAIHSKAFWGHDKPNFGHMFYVVNGRNYQFFARLASVRGDGRDPQGLPDDVSEMVQMFANAWEGDGHSHSWLSASDFADDYYGVEALESGEEEPMTEYHQNTLRADKNYAVLQFLQEMCGISGIGEECQANEFRFVFWFDN